MGQIDNLGSNPEFKDLLRRIRNLETKPQLGNTAVSRGSTVFKGLLSLIVEGSARVTGLLSIVGELAISGVLNATGTLNMNGPVNISGTQTVTGVLNVNGPWNLAGTGGITGNVSSTGNWTQTGNYTVSGSGKIYAGTGMFLGQTSRGPGLEFDDGSTFSKQTYGLAMVATTNAYVAASAAGVQMRYGSVIISANAIGASVTGNLAVSGSFTAASKSFKIPHPLKSDTWLLHGVTESNEHGVEYRGEATIGEGGSTAVELPDYFEALTVPGATVYVTGRGFCADWTDVVSNGFTVMGEPGKRFSWLVKAARSDVTLVVEEPMAV